MRAYYSTPACCNPLFPPITRRFSADSTAVTGPFGSPLSHGAPDSRTAITQDSASCLPLSPTCLSHLLSACRDDPRPQALKRELRWQRHLRTATVKVAARRG